MSKWKIVPLFIAALCSWAVEPGQVSKTSVWVMAARALGAYDFDPAVRNPDWLAERFLGAEERSVISDDPVIRAVEGNYRSALKSFSVTNLVRLQLVRTRFIDEQLARAVEGGATQVVILGAGFDSRAYRFCHLLRNARVFEVDYGPTQEHKKRRVVEVLGGPPRNLTYVSVDFTRQELGAALHKAGYQRQRKTFFICEGVLEYLTEQEVLETLRFVSGNSAPGSSIAFNYFTSRFIKDGPAVKELAPTFERVKNWGEPWIFGLPEGGERDYLHRVGLDLVEQLAYFGPEAVTRYLTRRDGSLVGEAPLPEMPTGWQNPMWLALAATPAR